jgi:hypothetical protein
MQIFLTITSTGERFFQFIKGKNNEVSGSSYFIALARSLDEKNIDWRDNHVLLLDNCSTQKTKLARSNILRLGFLVTYSASASFKTVPVKKVFGAMKRKIKNLPAKENPIRGG